MHDPVVLLDEAWIHAFLSGNDSNEVGKVGQLMQKRHAPATSPDKTGSSRRLARADPKSFTAFARRFSSISRGLQGVCAPAPSLAGYLQRR
jgi:hypothetical protein